MRMTGSHGIRGARALVTATLVSAAAVAGCSPGGSSPGASGFATRVHQLAPEVGTYMSDARLYDLGRAVCDDLSSGAPASQVADRMATTGAGAALPPADLGAVMQAATETICTRYSATFDSGGPG